MEYALPEKLSNMSPEDKRQQLRDIILEIENNSSLPNDDVVQTSLHLKLRRLLHAHNSSWYDFALLWWAMQCSGQR